MTPGPDVLSIEGLTVRIGSRDVVSDVSLTVSAGKTTALVGESGSGKTMTAMSVIRLLPYGADITEGAIKVGDIDICTLPERDLRAIRGARIGMVFQEPFKVLNPVMRLEQQIAEPLLAHAPKERWKVSRRVMELMEMVGLAPDAVRKYPHELSGGMQQRMLLAMALACGPELLILDEPTTALDVSTQMKVLSLVRELQRSYGVGILFITHDLSLVKMMADDVFVMFKGGIVEKGPVDKVLSSPDHFYTRALLESIPRIGDARKRLPEMKGSNGYIS
ncbi:MAG: ABC transporter ATP-binding protein [Candidatus Omnitrophica bacterium]|nr:ABC transporter ATP-binding protein [Candidatus Omnitrophota bacterium]MDD5488123.1 ABC transporter ATP-binding protein [Candidatus Omnitrophota bacterium]